ncbi:MAG: sulfatase-like hydrolase/transferase [Phycisphaerae bacterium]|nr:sulfatase-like hydrolase/transferase [Phycisphaerae bacterium]
MNRYKHTRRGFLKTIGIGAAAAVAPGLLSAAAPKRKPNVILVMTDDQGYGDLACHGNNVIKTPGLDELYKQSVRLKDFHVDPCCSPTRAALLTGRYSSRSGVWHTVMGRSLLRKTEVTMADVFASGGYRTGMFGKWHLGDNYPFRPQDRGFQETLCHGGGAIGNAPDYWGNDYFDDTYQRNGRLEKFTGYCTDVWFTEAIKFIKANRSRPFFCYLATNVPHGPWNVADKYAEAYKDGEMSRSAKFYGMIANFDENMARLTGQLKELGLADNTILIFLTDNGTAGGVRMDRMGNATSGYNAGMRGAKVWETEGGHRVPCFIRWPEGGIGGGRDVTPITAHLDLLPTLIDLCELKAPPKVKFDGVSLRPLLTGKAKDWPARTLFVHNQRLDTPRKDKNYQVMTDRWRLLNGRDLYDIKADPGQRKSIADKHPEIVERMKKQYDAWWADISMHFDVYDATIIGSPKANPTTLYTHDWHGPQLWDQSQVRRGSQANGFWALEVERDGKYAVELRRWPREVNEPITAAIDRGQAISATKARLLVGNIDESMAVTEKMKTATFTVNLKAGLTCMMTWFSDEESKQSRGAYYVYITRTGDGDAEALERYKPSTPEMMPRPTPGPRRRGSNSKSKVAKKKRFELKQGDDLPAERAPMIAGRSIAVEATIKPTEPNGVIVAQGGQGMGYALYIRDGRLAMAARINGRVVEAISPKKLPAGELKVAGRLAKNGTLSVYVAGSKVASRKSPGTIPMPSDGLQVGSDLVSAAGDYESPNKFSGTIKNVVITLDVK